MGSDPKEFRRVQKLMKEGRRVGGVHAGPESKVLDGISWEEARQMADAQVSHVDGGYGMKVGAASKGIIQRDFQHNAMVYKSPYAKNPFDMVSNEELEEYKRIINNKSKRDGEMSPTSPHEDTMGDTTDAGNNYVMIMINNNHISARQQPPSSLITLSNYHSLFLLFTNLHQEK